MISKEIDEFSQSARILAGSQGYGDRGICGTIGGAGMDFWSEIEEAVGGVIDRFKKPPEPLVLGAELWCPYGSEHTYLMLERDDIDIDNLSNKEYLKEAGFSETDIAKIQNGRVPNGWQVHHKLSLDDSGTNTFDNLVLIQNEPYHKVITNYQNSIARQMKVGEVQKVQWPVPNGNIYPPIH